MPGGNDVIKGRQGMGIAGVLERLGEAGIKLGAEDGQLKVSAPKGVMTNELKALLLEHKADLLRLLEQNARNVGRGRLLPVARTERMALSSAQLRLWFLQQLDEASVVYNKLVPLQIDGDLDLFAVQFAVDEIVARHEALRCYFVAERGEPSVLVDAQFRPKIEVRDVEVEHLPAEIGAEAHRPFRLDVPGLLRVTVLRLHATCHVIILTIHHIVSDGWSMGVLVHEFAALYTQYINGASSTLPDLPLQYLDYAAWQRTWMAGEGPGVHLEFWRERLRSLPPLLELPLDRLRPREQSYAGRTLRFELPGEMSTALQALAHRHHASLFMLLQAIFKILLARYSGQTDIAVGSPTANRERPELEGLIGFFVNTVVLRDHVDANLPFPAFLDQVKRNTLEAFAHQEISFDQLVEELQPVRSLSYSPLFQVLFTLQNAPLSDLALPGLHVRLLEHETESAKYDLSMELEETSRGLRGNVEYNTDLFDAPSIDALVRHFQVLLRNVLKDPERRVGELALMDEAERLQVLQRGTAAAVIFPQDGCVHDMIDAQIDAARDRVAVQFDEGALTYGELDQQATMLSRELIDAGVGVGQRVAICLARSPQLLVAMLAVMKSGAAYVPLDPAYPDERIAYVLADANVSMLLTESLCLQREWATSVPSRLFEHGRWCGNSTPSQRRISTRAQASDLAYVIYTSGSTGRPKGVAVEHRSVVNFLQAMARHPGLDGRDRLLAVTTIAFDIAVLELLLPLTVGATVILVDSESINDGARLRDLIRRTAPSVMQATPATWKLLLADGWRPNSSMRMLVGGEALGRDLADALSVSGVELWNMYGPTEATVWVGATRVEATSSQWSVAPIDDPIANSVWYVLDENLQPVPLGASGQLYIGGSVLARGYWNRPELTASEFVADPFATQISARMYRSGDLVRHRRQGGLDFLGRVDQQVKLRGYRIELGEIEQQLLACASVREAVAIVREDTPGMPGLVAYVTTHEETSAGELRDALRLRLPDYMVPVTYVFLAELPLTGNGKLDRKSLPRPDLAPREYAPPQTAIEITIAAIWSDVLKRDRIGIDEHFFEIGGHSLLATQVMARIREATGANLAIKALFEAPTVLQLAARVAAAGIDSHQPELISVDRTGALPLSFAQQRVWFLEQLEGPSSTYNIPISIDLRGKLDIDALHRALQHIVDRHETLRTTFHEQDGRPTQRVRPNWVLDLNRIEIAPTELTARVVADALAPFDLGKPGLIRAQLLQLGNEHHVLLLTMHHIVSDGWSLGILVDELSEGYRAHHLGIAPQFAELSIQYADFAVWQRRCLQGEALTREVDYWKTKLSGLPALLPLPTDRPRPAVQSYRGTVETAQIPAALLARLQTLSRENGATLYMTVLAAFNVLLARYSGTRDIAVGSSIANRPRPELEKIIGFFVNTLILRTQVDESLTFSELLRRVRDEVLDAYAHQDVPFEQLVEALQPVRSLSHSPWFQVMLVLQNTPMNELQLPDLALTVRDPHIAVAKYDISLYLSESRDGLRADLEYNIDLFDATTIQRLLRHYCNLLTAIVDHGGRPLSELTFLDEAERSRVVHEWNGEVDHGRDDLDVVCRIEHQAARNPQSTAVQMDDRCVSYAALNAAANRIAHGLREQGIGTDALVGIYLERSPQLIEALLGILKSGAGYLPLDIKAPKERLAYQLGDAKPALVLTHSSLLANLVGSDMPALCMDCDTDKWIKSHGNNPNISAHPHSVAYAIYTSGSTGQPKAAQISRQALGTFCHAAIVRYGITRDDRVLQFAAIGFDASIEEIFPTLCCGATLVLRNDGMLDTIDDFVRRSVELDLTVWDLPTAFWHQLAAELPQWGHRSPPRLRATIIGGERADSASVVLWQHSFGERVRLFNSYGPTEATVVATAAELPIATDTGTMVSIGRPLSNATCYILDDWMNPLPSGISGQLHIGGSALSRGYLGRPDLTAANFIPDPFSAIPGQRLYRTGDLARHRADGELEFLGRLDHQVKVRGFRVELGEVEAALLQIDGVDQAAVSAIADSHGQLSLRAYVSGSVDLDPEQLLATLSGRLPDYMLPGRLVCVPAMPLNLAGKVDKAALSKLDALPAPEHSYAAPRNPQEEQLAGIWADVLGIERVGIHDNFFRIGGHSLLATQVVSRVRASLSLAISIKILFEKPTIAELAALAVQGPAPGESAITPVPRDAPLRLSFAQQRLWFLDQLEGGSATYSMPGAFLLNGRLDVAALRGSIQKVVDRHESLRTTFAPGEADGETLQVIAPQLDIEVPLIEVAESDISVTVQAFFDQPFDLGSGPLLRVQLLRREESRHVMLLNMHHIISDAWSIGVLVNELVELYRAGVEQRQPRLLPLPVQYADFANWQRSWLQGDALERQIGYWRQRLKDLPPLLELPTDRPRPAEQRYRGRQAPFAIPRSLVDTLNQFSRSESATLFMTLLAAFQVLLARYSGQSDIAVGTPIANRMRPEFERLIGFFVNTLVLRSHVDMAQNFRTLLSEVRGHTLSAYEHQDVPFEQLVGELNPERSLSHAPLFQVMFVLQNAPMGVIDLPDLSLLPAEGDVTISKFDLRLDLQEIDDGLVGLMEYNTDLFDAATIGRMIEHYQCLLQSLVDNAQCAIGAVAMLADAERKRLCVEWNDTAIDYPVDRLIHEMMVDHAHHAPDSIALVFEDEHLSYAE
ncbi:MAG: amino acid adenylation domain-containing protein, partial [Tahibacter sp.]